MASVNRIDFIGLCVSNLPVYLLNWLFLLLLYIIVKNQYNYCCLGHTTSYSLARIVVMWTDEQLMTIAIQWNINKSSGLKDHNFSA